MVRDNNAQPDPEFTCNAEETDTRVWLHAKKTKWNRIMIVSPDTDVYNIGLPLENTMKEVIIQVSPPSKRELKLLHMTNLRRALANDPDLAHIDPTILPRVLQTLYVSTGCDYTSFFSHIGKSSTFSSTQHLSHRALRQQVLYQILVPTWKGSSSHLCV